MERPSNTRSSIGYAAGDNTSNQDSRNEHPGSESLDHGITSDDTPSNDAPSNVHLNNGSSNQVDECRQPSSYEGGLGDDNVGTIGDGSADDQVAEGQSTSDTASTPGGHQSTGTISNDPYNFHRGNNKTGSSRPRSKEATDPHRFHLILYAVLFLVIIILLEALNFVSKRQQGLANASREDHYLWTYGPTFFLTILAAFWKQFEHHAKQIMPWVAIDQSQTTAEEGLLLDYESEFTLKALAISLKMMHIPVIAGIVGTLLLGALTITSTALFSLRSTTYLKEIDMGLRNEFNFTLDDFKYYPKGPTDAASVVWVVRDLNLSFPFGTTSTLAAQTFIHPAEFHDQTVYGDVQVFSAELQDCEPFQHFSLNDGFNDSRLRINVQTDSCLAENSPIIYADGGSGWINRPGSVIDKVECSNVTPEHNPSRILISFSPTPMDGEISGLFTGIICNPVYSLTKRKMMSLSPGLNTGVSIITAEETEQRLALNLSLPEFNFDLGLGLYHGRAIPDTTERNTLTPWFRLMNQSLPQKEMTDFLDLAILTEAAQQTFRTVVPQWVNLAYLSPSDNNISGTAIFRHDRLYVTSIPLRTMETILIILAGGCIVTSIKWPARVPSLSSGSLMTRAVALSRSPDLGQMLCGTGAVCEKHLKQRLADFTFTVSETSESHPHSISSLPRPVSEVGSIRLDDVGQESKWRRPTAASPVFRAAILGTPLVLVAVLEVILQLSLKHGGLATVDDNSPVRYGWLYGPTTMMALIGLAFHALSATALALHPFQGLRKGYTKIQVLMKDPAGSLPPVALIEALSNAHFALAATLVSVLASSFLTISSSGLYTTRVFPQSGQVTLRTTDSFNISNVSTNQISNVSIDVLRGSGLHNGRIAGAVQFFNLSFPSWTYDEVAFSQLETNVLEAKEWSLTAQIPAVRAKMNCSAQYYPVLEKPLNDGSGFRIDPPPICSRLLPNGSLAQLQLAPAFNIDIPNFESALDTNIFATKLFLEEEEKRCASGYLWWIVGNFTHDDTSAYSNATILYCKPFIERLLVDTSFKMPGFIIDESKPPRPKESTAEFFGNTLEAVIPWVIPDKVFRDLDTLFQTAMWGRDPIPIEELYGESNIPRLLEKAEHTYRQIVAQNLNAYFRTPETSSAPETTLDGVSTQTEMRLVQTAVSTRILEGLLLFMAISAGISFFLERSTRILPKNPGSIASAMSLFANSDFLEVLSQDHSTTESEKRLQDGALKEYRFRLGWWREGTDRERFGIDIERPGESNTSDDDEHSSTPSHDNGMDTFDV